MTTDEPAKVNTNDNPKEKPTRAIIIPKHGKKSKKKNRYMPPTFPDEREDFDFLFNGSFGRFIQKKNDFKDLLSPLNKEFYVEYNKNKHSAELNKYLKFDDEISQEVQNRVTNIVKSIGLVSVKVALRIQL